MRGLDEIRAGRSRGRARWVMMMRISSGGRLSIGGEGWKTFLDGEGEGSISSEREEWERRRFGGDIVLFVLILGVLRRRWRG